MATTLLLWDIDHTLIETRGVGGQVYADTFRIVTGRPLDIMPALAGRTEPAIFREALKTNHIDGDPAVLFRQFAAQQARGYATRTHELRKRGRALPGAKDALRVLDGRADVIQSVLTGNTRPSAQIKLAAFNLDKYLDLDIGAYGTDDEIRANLVTIARSRAASAHRTAIEPADTVLIGDTPNDVWAARASGARIIAVATGCDSASELAATGADTVLPDLTSTDDLLTAIITE